MSKNKKMITVLAIVLVSATACMLSACADGEPTKAEEYLSASWNYNYGDVKEMSQNSDLIALVTVLETKVTMERGVIPYTIFTVNVDTPVYNSEKNQHFSLRMIGKETDDRIIAIEDDPLLRPGDKLLVFCKKNTDGTYRTLSGSQGRLIYDNGKLNSLNVVDERVGKLNPFSNIMVENADAYSLIAEIKEYAGVK